jgi:hypothetical protein
MSPPRELQPMHALTAADVVNEEIRAFMRARYGRPLHTDEAAEYARLLERWWAANRTHFVPAA